MSVVLTETLATKYRPSRIADLRGQPGIQQMLRRLRTEAPSKSYLIYGPSGGGKTTIARLLAATLNCASEEEAGDGWDLCGECASCRSILRTPPAEHGDYQEMNAADGGIDDVRALERVLKLSPASRFRVVAIDEAHALPPKAKSFLLKALEEPQSRRAVWVLCTTEPGAFGVPIRRRCEDIEVRATPPKAIAATLARICVAEQRPIEKEMILRLAAQADGSPGQAVKMLQNVLRGTRPGADVAAAVQREADQSPDELARRLLLAVYSETDLSPDLLDALRSVSSWPYLAESMLRHHAAVVEMRLAGMDDATRDRQPLSGWLRQVSAAMTKACSPDMLMILVETATATKRYEVDGRYHVLSALARLAL